MSNPPDVVTGDIEAAGPDSQSAPPAVPSTSEAGARRTTHDLWLSGTEAPVDTGRFTDEGSQEMLLVEDHQVLAEQMGTLVFDDYDRPAGEPSEETQKSVCEN